MASHAGTLDIGGNRRLAFLNTRGHERALWLFLVVVVAHWAEHLFQAFQVFVLSWARPDSRGALGQVWPWLAKTETLHYGYAIFMLTGLGLLLPGFTGTGRTWWRIALWIQVWHHLEHVLLLLQYQLGTPFFGRDVPTSVLQLVVSRVELHLFYNAAVFIPMVIAMWYHRHPLPGETPAQGCTCARVPA